jgi:PQQ-dependent catabolism-associated CXXCW motif protein
MLRLMAGLALALAQPGLFDVDGYRAASFRAPVDRDPAPAQRLALAAARDLRPGRDALFVDVLALTRDAATGRWLQTEAHDTISGAIWRPEVGRPGVDPALWAGLRGRIATWRGAHPGAPVVLFCRVDCWMGWNAARRLAREGVGQVYWLAEGVEGWREAGGALTPAKPTPAKPEPHK